MRLGRTEWRTVAKVSFFEVFVVMARYSNWKLRVDLSTRLHALASASRYWVAVTMGQENSAVSDNGSRLPVTRLSALPATASRRNGRSNGSRHNGVLGARARTRTVVMYGR